MVEQILELGVGLDLLPQRLPACANVGEAGNDMIDAGNGNDFGTGNVGADTVSGGNGDDELFGGPGADVLNGENGNDLLIGTFGNDTLNGGAGDDLLDGDLPPQSDDPDAPPAVDPNPNFDICDGGGGNDAGFGCEVATNVEAIIPAS